MTETDDLLRLQKYLAMQGLCSRRQAETWIGDGLVTVNGKVAELGCKVNPGKDRILVRGKPVSNREQAACSILLNKPRGFICSNSDPHHQKTVFGLLPPKFDRMRLFCAGRLDKDSEGLLIITNDGQFAQRLTHPASQVVKRYRVLLNRPFDKAGIPSLLKGVVVEGERLSAGKVIPATRGPDREKRLEIHLAHGRKREIRRMLEALDYRVKRLQRFQIGRLTLRGLSPGRYRLLKPEDLNLLFS